MAGAVSREAELCVWGALAMLLAGRYAPRPIQPHHAASLLQEIASPWLRSRAATPDLNGALASALCD
jgi:hypothetical protein